MMKRFFRHSIYALIMTVCLVVTSCDDKDGVYEQPSESLYNLAIHITPVSTRAASGDNEVNEMIESLRIIIVNSDSVELNKLVNIDIPGGILASDFQYDFLYKTIHGDKNFYFIANEAYVGGIHLYTPAGSTSAPTLPDGITDGSPFTDLLDVYQPGYSDLSEMAEIMENIYFTPDYVVEDGNVCLPYTSFYENINVPENEHIAINMYMVPAATKFFFNFTNYRVSGVKINGISMNYANSSNFVFAQVGSNDYEKSLPGSNDSLYWIDWLAEVSKLSYDNQGFNSNMNFNTTYGWISDYNIPDLSQGDSFIKEFVTLEDAFTVDGDPTAEDGLLISPGTASAGPFYVPESKQSVQSGTLEQTYYLTIAIEDLDENKLAPDFENIAIPNFKALFRNTYIVINVTMRQGNVEIYAEMSPWNTNNAQGWVIEGGIPNL